MSPPVRTERPFMPGYGLPADTASLKPWSWAELILAAGHNYWVSTTRPDGRPHTMPVWGVWHDDAFWFSTGVESRKAKNLAARAECVVTVERGTVAVIVEGAAALRPAADTPKQIAALYLEKYEMGYPEDSSVFRVAPRVVFGFSEAAEEFGETATRWTFEP